MSIEMSKSAAKSVMAMVEGRCGQKQVDKLLRELPDGWRWKHLQGWGTFSGITTGELPALTELLTNSVDACIRLRATEMAIKAGAPVSGPEFDRMFRSPRHATEELFGIPDGNLVNWTGDQSSLASSVASLILELGDSSNYRRHPTVKIVDYRGIGQPESNFRDTFLKTGEGDKFDRPWEAGTYGIGSVVAARICPYQIVVSKRAPSALPPGASEEPWGILIIRTELVSNESGEKMMCSVLAYGEDGREEFPVLPDGTKLHVRETYSVRKCTSRLGKGEKVALVREKEAHSRRVRGESAEMVCETVNPTSIQMEKGVVELARVVARRPLPHGTVRMLVDTQFTEPWIEQPVGTGIFRQIERAIPDPILPFLVVENRFASRDAIELGARSSLPMFGRTSALSKTAGEPIHIPVEGIEIDGVDMGCIDVSIFYSPSGFSDSLSEFARLPRLIRAGQVVGNGDTHAFSEMIGFSKFTDRFACLVSIDRLRNGPKLTKICSAGRTVPDSKAVSRLWGRVVTAVRNNGEMKRIRAEMEKNMPKSNELAKQISRVLGGSGDGEDGEIILSGKNRVPVCVKGTDMPVTDNPDYVWINREPRFSGKKRCLETLKPVRLESGKSSTMGVATSSRKKIAFARKSCPYKLEAYVDGGGVEAKIVRNSLVITASRAVKNAKPAVVIVYATNDSGFKSVPGVVKILPVKPKSRTQLLPEPTFVKISGAFANKKLPVGKAEVVRFTTDANSSFSGFSGEARFGNRVFPVHAEGIGKGRGLAYVPTIDGAQDGDICLLSIVAKGDDGTDVAACSDELVVVAEKPTVGIKAIKKKKEEEKNKQSQIDAPGEPKGLRIEFQEVPDQWGCTPDSEAEVVDYGGEIIGVINKLAPTFVASMNGIREEAGHARKVEEREELYELERDYYDRVSVAIRDVVGEMEDAEDRGRFLEGAKRELRRVARSHPLMFHFDRARGVKYARYDKYAKSE